MGTRVCSIGRGWVGDRRAGTGSRGFGSGILSDWLEAGEIRAVIDRNYKLDEIPDALTSQGRFHAQGKVVVTV